MVSSTVTYFNTTADVENYEILQMGKNFKVLEQICKI
jgi:hypothetical protein